MFISTPGPRVGWRGLDTPSAAAEKRTAVLLYKRLTDMSSNAFNAWSDLGLKAEPEEPWYQQPGEPRNEDSIVSTLFVPITLEAASVKVLTSSLSRWITDTP